MKGSGVQQIAPGAILDSLNDGVVTIGLDKRVQYLNRAAEQLLGYTLEEARNQPCATVVHCTVCDTDCLLDRTLSTGKNITQYETLLKDKCGRMVTVSSDIALLRNKGGAVIGGVEVIRDRSRVQVPDRKPIGEDWMDLVIQKKYPLKVIERQLLLRVLNETKWYFKEAAERLKISRTTLWRKMKEFEIDRRHLKSTPIR